MPDLQQQIIDLRARVDALGDMPDQAELDDLERSARVLLADAKNTPYEAAAQALFADLARANSPASPTATTVRGLVRRARIRIEVAGDDDDIDEAIDILTEALSLNPKDADVLALLDSAAERSPQARQRVADLYARYGVRRPPTAPTPPPLPAVRDSEPPPSTVTTGEYPSTQYPTSSGYPPPERDLTREGKPPIPPRRPTGSAGPTISGGELDSSVSELTQAYYAGDYKLVVDLANSILNKYPGNQTALDYRQKAEDNLIRGVVPDHRIPFDARISYNRANSLVRAGSYDEAARLYQEARELAERAGIASWKDPEQALIEIQELADAREFIIEGDRLMNSDNWIEATRRYEGALRIVPNDPQAEERLEKVRRLQQESENIGVQLATLSGSISEQVAQLQSVLTTLARLRPLLPNSQRLAALSTDAANRVQGLKTQITDQSRAAVSRANGATSIEERLALLNEARALLEQGVRLDPGDTAMSQQLLETRATNSELQRAKEVIERAASLIALNQDNDLVQARSMLAGLKEYAQDSRYRSVVSDLLARIIERAVAALDDGSLDEAQALTDIAHEEPFTILGRRPEVARSRAADSQHSPTQPPAPAGLDRRRPDPDRLCGDAHPRHLAASVVPAANRHTNRDLYTKHDLHAVGNAYQHEYANRQPYTDGYRHANRYGNAHAHAYANANAVRHAHADQYADANGHAHCHAYARVPVRGSEYLGRKQVCARAADRQFGSDQPAAQRPPGQRARNSAHRKR